MQESSVWPCTIKRLLEADYFIVKKLPFIPPPCQLSAMTFFFFNGVAVKRVNSDQEVAESRRQGQ